MINIFTNKKQRTEALKNVSEIKQLYSLMDKMSKQVEEIKIYINSQKKQD